jgi:hypothetical protein
MSTAAREVYVREVEHRLNLPGRYHVHWEPNSLCNLGDVGRKEDRDWQTTIQADGPGYPLHDLGTSSSGTPAPFSFTAGGKVDIHAALKGSTDAGFSFIGQASAGIKVSFEKSDSVLLAAPDAAYQQLPSDLEVARQMKEAWNTESLRYGDQVIVGIYRANSFVILVSSSAGASADITTDATIREGVVDVAAVHGSLGIVNSSSMGYQTSSHDAGAVVLGHRALELAQEGIIFRHPGVRTAQGIIDEPAYDLILPLE